MPLDPLAHEHLGPTDRGYASRCPGRGSFGPNANSLARARRRRGLGNRLPRFATDNAREFAEFPSFEWLGERDEGRDAPCCGNEHAIGGDHVDVRTRLKLCTHGVQHSEGTGFTAVMPKLKTRATLDGGDHGRRDPAPECLGGGCVTRQDPCPWRGRDEHPVP